MKNVPVVCYLFTCFDDINSLKNFKNNYLKFDAGLDHDLVICFKLLESKQVQNIVKELTDIKFHNFEDSFNKNDFDFGSYKRVSEKYIDRDIFFLNSHSYPLCNNWLKLIMFHKDDNNLIGTSASYESILESIKIKKKYKFFSYLLNIFKFKKNFPSFPNPHIRTSSFLIKSNIFLDFIYNKKINSKFDAWKIESGNDSLTNFFKKKGLSVYIVNSEGKKFIEKDWMSSETYCYSRQLKSIISDKHTRKYHALSKKNQILTQLKVWGK